MKRPAVLIGTVLLLGALIVPLPAHALTAPQADDAFSDFVNVYWDDAANYFFTYSDHQIHPEHAHGPQGGLYTDYWWKNVDVGNGALNEKNVATNATAVYTAMRIYAATGDVSYRTKAQGLFTWLDSNFYVDGKLRDHIQGTGQFVDWDWTYNQGNYAGAALEMYLESGNTVQLDRAVAIMHQASPDGIAGPIEGTRVYEAENAERSGVLSESNELGYNARGYIGGWISDGSGVTFHVNVVDAGTYDLEFRYAAAAGNAVRSLAVNGATTSLSFPGTAGWGDWQTATESVPLVAGYNRVDLRFDGAAGRVNYVNLDRALVTD